MYNIALTLENLSSFTFASVKCLITYSIASISIVSNSIVTEQTVSKGIWAYTYTQTSKRHRISGRTNADNRNTELLLMGDFLGCVWGYSWVYKPQIDTTTIMTLSWGNYKLFLKVLKDALGSLFSLSFWWWTIESVNLAQVTRTKGSNGKATWGTTFLKSIITIFKRNKIKGQQQEPCLRSHILEHNESIPLHRTFACVKWPLDVHVSNFK